MQQVRIQNSDLHHVRVAECEEVDPPVVVPNGEPGQQVSPAIAVLRDRTDLQAGRQAGAPRRVCCHEGLGVDRTRPEGIQMVDGGLEFDGWLLVHTCPHTYSGRSSAPCTSSP